MDAFRHPFLFGVLRCLGAKHDIPTEQSIVLNKKRAIHLQKSLIDKFNWSMIKRILGTCEKKHGM